MRRLIGAALLLLLVLGGGPGLARAGNFNPAELMLLKLFGSDPITADMFTPGFLAEASIEQVLSVFAKMRANVGPPVSIEERGGGYIVHTANYAVPVDIGLDPSGRIAALLLHPPTENFADSAAVLAAIDALPGRVSYLVTRNGQTLHARGQTMPLATSSAFKLAVLAVLADEVDAKALAWDTVVRLRPDEISLAPGVLQDMPVGSPMTVHTLAAFMMAQSDNTATDVLIDLVGRDKVERKLQRNFILKTTEFEKLKADPALRLRFNEADAAGKLAMVPEMAALPLPRPADTGAPLNPGVEWYASASQLCRLVDRVAGLDVAQINQGVARPEDWAKIAFKSGSEVGVASLVTALTDKAGTHYCVALTVNDDQALDETRITSLYGSLIGKLAERQQP